MVEADPDAPAAEALFNILLEVADQHAGPEAVTRLRTSHPAVAIDDLAHGVIDGAGPILDDEAMGVAARLLIALNPARFAAPRFASAEDAFNTYQRELTPQRRTERFAAREGEANSFWQRQIAKQEDAVRTARAGWRAAIEKALAAGESPKREAAAARDGEEALELLTRRYGRAAAGEIRAAVVAADDGCTLWSALVHDAAQKVLGAQFEAERWESMAPSRTTSRRSDLDVGCPGYEIVAPSAGSGPILTMDRRTSAVQSGIFAGHSVPQRPQLWSQLASIPGSSALTHPFKVTASMIPAGTIVLNLSAWR